MVNKDNYRISSVEMTITVMSTIIGVGILTLPRSLAKSVGTPDIWIPIIIGLIANMAMATLIIKLHQRTHGQSILQYVQEKNKVGYFLTKFLTLGFICYFTFIISFEARIVTEVVGVYLINQTPSEVVIIFMYLAITYAVTKSLQGIIHLNLLFFPIVFLVLLFIIMFNLQEFDYKSLLPIGAEGMVPIIRGSKETIVSFLGIEILFFFMVYSDKKSVSSKYINIGLAIVGILYLCFTLLAISILGLEATKVVTYPTIELTKEIEIIQGLIERLEPLIIIVWILTIFNTMSNFHFIVTNIIKEQFFPGIRAASIAIILATISFVITFIPNSLQETFSFGDFIGYLGLGLTLFTIMIGYLYIVKNKKRDTEQSEVR